MRRTIFILFAILFFFVPLILWPFTSEVFEFNKMVLTYILTALIVAAWIVRSIISRKIIFRRTILDIPLLVFLGSQLISTIISIDPLTSWLGYYSRFNGGLVSDISYALLYWAFVSNFEKKDTLKLINYAFLPGAALVSLYAIAEHFGIDKNIWVQDVQSRVFSTLGQPNWLAAWVVALIPITWAFSLESTLKKKKFWIYFALSVLFFWTLIFTKSRSGLLGFVVTFLIFWAGYFWFNRKEYKSRLKPFAVFITSLIVISLISGTEYTPSINSLISKSTSTPVTNTESQGPALEVGGTQSTVIRKIVWKGAVQIWLHYPIFGTGVETFAYSYYGFRPVEHNLTTEWDFIYNKAHNEFLNMAANSGTVGLLAYLILIGFSIYLFVQKFLAKNGDPELKIWNLALLAGFTSLSVTNFFGFSVVPTQLEFFLFPAFALALVTTDETKEKSEKIDPTRKFLIAILLAFSLYLLLLISRYWYADTLYAKGKAYNGAQKPDVAIGFLTKAISLEPNQALYHSEVAGSYTSIALYYNGQKDSENTDKFVNLALGESDKAVSLSPANVNLKRSRFGVFIMLSAIDPKYMLNARDTLIDAIALAPTDAKLYYNLGLTYARTGQPDKAMEILVKTIELKSNYKEARLAYAYLLIDKKMNSQARDQLNYILGDLFRGP